jgi:hypothetical protein
MNHIIYNFALIILFVGIVLMTIYITRATMTKFMPKEQQLLELQQVRRREPTQNIFDYRISKTYRDMFYQPSIWLGYQDFNPEFNTDKLYVKQE